MSAGYVIKEGFAGLGRAKLAAATSIFSLFIAVLLVAVLFRVGYNAYELAAVLQQQVEVELFLEEGFSKSSVEEKLSSQQEIASFTYISQDSAAAVFQQEFGVGSENIASLNFLPASFRLVMQEDVSVSQVDSLARLMNEWDEVEDVRFNLDLLETIEERTETFLIAGASIGVFILLVAIILVFNTIRLTIYAKRDLIRAMKLVGATNAFIRRPFLVEGVLQGIIGGSAAILALYLIFEVAIVYYVPQAAVLSWPYGSIYWMAGGVMLLSVLLGWWGSRLAARKFIKSAEVY